MAAMANAGGRTPFTSPNQELPTRGLSRRGSIMKSKMKINAMGEEEWVWEEVEVDSDGEEIVVQDDEVSRSSRAHHPHRPPAPRRTRSGSSKSRSPPPDRVRAGRRPGDSGSRSGSSTGTPPRGGTRSRSGTPPARRPFRHPAGLSRRFSSVMRSKKRLNEETGEEEEVWEEVLVNSDGEEIEDADEWEEEEIIEDEDDDYMEEESYYEEEEFSDDEVDELPSSLKPKPHREMSLIMEANNESGTEFFDADQSFRKSRRYPKSGGSIKSLGAGSARSLGAGSTKSARSLGGSVKSRATDKPMESVTPTTVTTTTTVNTHPIDPAQDPLVTRVPPSPPTLPPTTPQQPTPSDKTATSKLAPDKQSILGRLFGGSPSTSRSKPVTTAATKKPSGSTTQLATPSKAQDASPAPPKVSPTPRKVQSREMGKQQPAATATDKEKVAQPPKTKSTREIHAPAAQSLDRQQQHQQQQQQPQQKGFPIFRRLPLSSNKEYPEKNQTQNQPAVESNAVAQAPSTAVKPHAAVMNQPVPVQLPMSTKKGMPATVSPTQNEAAQRQERTAPSIYRDEELGMIDPEKTVAAHSQENNETEIVEFAPDRENDSLKKRAWLWGSDNDSDISDPDAPPVPRKSKGGDKQTPRNRRKPRGVENETQTRLKNTPQSEYATLGKENRTGGVGHVSLCFCLLLFAILIVGGTVGTAYFGTKLALKAAGVPPKHSGSHGETTPIEPPVQVVANNGCSPREILMTFQITFDSNPAKMGILFRTMGAISANIWNFPVGSFQSFYQVLRRNRFDICLLPVQGYDLIITANNGSGMISNFAGQNIYGNWSVSLNGTETLTYSGDCNNTNATVCGSFCHCNFTLFSPDASSPPKGSCRKTC